MSDAAWPMHRRQALLGLGVLFACGRTGGEEDGADSVWESGTGFWDTDGASGPFADEDSGTIDDTGDPMRRRCHVFDSASIETIERRAIFGSASGAYDGSIMCSAGDL